METIAAWILAKFGISVPVAKIVMIGAAVLAAVALYFWWQHEVEKTALLKFNNKQLEQVVREQASVQAKLDELAKDQQKLLRGQDEYKTHVDQSFANASKYLASDEAKKNNRPSSEILKRTVEEMAKAQKALQ
jgi:uncharacterized protein HemX